LRDRLLPELSELIKRFGLTALYVTHDRDEAFALADRVGVMDDGRLVQIDSPGSLMAAPASDQVARLLGLS